MKTHTVSPIRPQTPLSSTHLILQLIEIQFRLLRPLLPEVWIVNVDIGRIVSDETGLRECGAFALALQPNCVCSLLQNLVNILLTESGGRERRERDRERGEGGGRRSEGSTKGRDSEREEEGGGVREVGRGERVRGRRNEQE